MQQIHVSRYSQPTATGYLGSIAPADGSWIVFVPTEGDPQLFVRQKLEPGETQVEHGYINVLDVPRQEAGPGPAA